MITKPDKPHDSIPPASTPNADPIKVKAGLQYLASAALGEGWMEKVRARKSERTVSANELTSLSALIVYVAHKTGVAEFRIERDLADRFSVTNVKCLPASRYDEAMRYLVDLVPADVAA